MVSCGHASMQMVNLTSDPGPRGRKGLGPVGLCGVGVTLSPLARLMARRGRSTRSTRRIFTTETALELGKEQSSGPDSDLASDLGGVGWAKGHLLDAKRDEGHTDHQQIQQIEPTTAEGASVQEGSEHCHLGVRGHQARPQIWG